MTQGRRRLCWHLRRLGPRAQELTGPVHIRLKPWSQGQGKSFENALSLLTRRMARQLGKDLRSDVRKILQDFEHAAACAVASKYAALAHIRGTDCNRNKLL